MSTMDTIKSTLDTLAASETYPFSGGVYYGILTAQMLPEWNYFVFNRTTDEVQNDHRATCRYEVHIVHEDYVMEDYPFTVIDALKAAVPGFSVAEDTRYEYITKGDTDMIVEICTLTFKQARKV